MLSNSAVELRISIVDVIVRIDGVRNRILHLRTIANNLEKQTILDAFKEMKQF